MDHQQMYKIIYYFGVRLSKIMNQYMLISTTKHDHYVTLKRHISDVIQVRRVTCFMRMFF